MPRSINEIHDKILADIANNAFLTDLNSTSAVAIFRLIAYIVAVSIHMLELMFYQHKSEVSELLYNQKSGRLPWYRYMALKFQYGFDLLPDSDEFDNTGATTTEIESSKIIKYAAVNEGDQQGVIVVKIAGESNGVLAPITAQEQTSVEAYFEEIKYAGSRINIINFLPDQLYLTIQIFRDPLVLDSNGNSILNGGRPVETAINEFMKELPFDGELILQSLVDKLQVIEGVKIVNLLEVKSSWIENGSYGTPSLITVKRIPESGYFEIVNFSNITYVV
ncbi:nucleotidyltransferase [Pseudotamlana carrageenivorans]|uniref:Nucleotidyltransferase n=1 Tax=Pseudotamlana carrageenivorans TaxID=2069432 RepID=A0A2I7SKM9_9FLAO|nr:nucleotidyltransferase [Tamlana carrageenivorans]AUS06489.1 nucleotidyltransferase [Tamlana carrageenivorans]